MPMSRLTSKESSSESGPSDYTAPVHVMDERVTDSQGRLRHEGNGKLSRSACPRSRPHLSPKPYERTAGTNDWMYFRKHLPPEFKWRLFRETYSVYHVAPDNSWDRL